MCVVVSTCVFKCLRTCVGVPQHVCWGVPTCVLECQHVCWSVSTCVLQCLNVCVGVSPHVCWSASACVFEGQHVCCRVHKCCSALTATRVLRCCGPARLHINCLHIMFGASHAGGSLGAYARLKPGVVQHPKIQALPSLSAASFRIFLLNPSLLMPYHLAGRWVAGGQVRQRYSPRAMHGGPGCLLGPRRSFLR